MKEVYHFAPVRQKQLKNLANSYVYRIVTIPVEIPCFYI